MGNNMEKEPKSKTEKLIINNEEFQKFIKDRGVKPEDLSLIEKLALFPKDIIIMDLHNLFNTYHERSGRELERMIKNESDSQRAELYEVMRQFYEKYGWGTGWHLERLLEKTWNTTN